MKSTVLKLTWDPVPDAYEYRIDHFIMIDCGESEGTWTRECLGVTESNEADVNIGSVPGIAMMCIRARKKNGPLGIAKIVHLFNNELINNNLNTLLPSPQNIRIISERQVINRNNNDKELFVSMAHHPNRSQEDIGVVLCVVMINGKNFIEVTFNDRTCELITSSDEKRWGLRFYDREGTEVRTNVAGIILDQLKQEQANKT